MKSAYAIETELVDLQRLLTEQISEIGPHGFNRLELPEHARRYDVMMRAAVATLALNWLLTEHKSVSELLRERMHYTGDAEITFITLGDGMVLKWPMGCERGL